MVMQAIQAVPPARRDGTNLRKRALHVFRACQGAILQRKVSVPIVRNVTRESFKATRMLQSVMSGSEERREGKECRSGGWLAALGTLSPTRIQLNVMYVLQGDA